jgi:hypothetical protein
VAAAAGGESEVQLIDLGQQANHGGPFPFPGGLPVLRQSMIHRVHSGADLDALAAAEDAPWRSAG